MSEHSSEEEIASSILIAAGYAAAGGVLPTLCRLAPLGIEGNVESIISPGHLVAIGIYALIGFLVCLGFRERKYRQAFVLGIAAPGLITNILAGAEVSPRDNLSYIPNLSFFSVAYADTYTSTKENSDFWVDLKRGLGFSVPSPKGAGYERSITPVSSTRTKVEVETEPTEVEEISIPATDSEEMAEVAEEITELANASDHGYLHFKFEPNSLSEAMVESSHSRFRYFINGASDAPMLGSGWIDPDLFLKTIDPQSVCNHGSAVDFKDRAIRALKGESQPLVEFPGSIFDALSVAEEATFRARVADAFAGVTSVDKSTQGSCRSSATEYEEAADQLYSILLDAVYP